MSSRSSPTPEPEGDGLVPVVLRAPCLDDAGAAAGGCLDDAGAAAGGAMRGPHIERPLRDAFGGGGGGGGGAKRSSTRPPASRSSMAVSSSVFLRTSMPLMLLSGEPSGMPRWLMPTAAPRRTPGTESRSSPVRSPAFVEISRMSSPESRVVRERNAAHSRAMLRSIATTRGAVVGSVSAGASASFACLIGTAMRRFSRQKTRARRLKPGQTMQPATRTSLPSCVSSHFSTMRRPCVSSSAASSAASARSRCAASRFCSATARACSARCARSASSARSASVVLPRMRRKRFAAWWEACLACFLAFFAYTLVTEGFF
mmetsp:Transcript_29798/g.77075  ORF Transcript_29798/g.77075 Transcript_29798/m.77075 type:complete len:316 (+) Transcript_29798:835-1782(+)